MGGLRSPFCRDRRSGTTGRAGVGGAVRLSTGNALDSCWRGIRRMCAGLRHPAIFCAPRWQVADGNGAGGDWQGGRVHRLRLGPLHHCHPAGSGRSDRGECVEGKSVGSVHDCDDHSDCTADGVVRAADSAGQGSGGVTTGVRVGRAGDSWWPVGVAELGLGALVYFYRADAGDCHHHLWVRRLCASGVAAAGAAGLPEYVREAGRNFAAGDWNCGGTSAAANAGVDAVH